MKLTVNKSKIIAEIGWNHMGDMNLAKEMISAASENGADIVKFQTWSEKNLKKGSWDIDGRREIYRKAELTPQNYEFLIDLCNNLNIEFCTSIFNIIDLEILKKFKFSYIKIPSHEVYNINLISNVSKFFDNILISTGACLWSEIIAISKLDCFNKITFLHCVSAYPCPADSINFTKFFKIKETFNKVGYSGHYQGIDDAILAITYNADFVEKHFTIDNSLPGRDNKAAILPSDLKKIYDYRENIHLMNMNKGLDVQEIEKDIYNNYRGRWSIS